MRRLSLCLCVLCVSAPLVFSQQSKPLPTAREFAAADPRARAEAFDAIRRAGASAVPLLTELLGSADASIRREAVGAMIDLAPDTETAQPALVRALNDEDVDVARDAARALGALGERAAPSVAPLAKALSHWDAKVQTYAAEALSSIGPAAAPATSDLTTALHELDPGVRWAAAEALSAIGPKAAPAVPSLIEALKDDFLYVRICAAGALGSIGLKSDTVIAALKHAAGDPAMRAEAEWALEQLTPPLERGSDRSSSDRSSVRATESTRGSDHSSVRATESAADGNPPADWDLKTGRNIVWNVDLGYESFGHPVVSGGVVYVGSDNARKLEACGQRGCGVLLAFRSADGELLWQDAAPRVDRGVGDFLLPSNTSSPHVEGDRLFYVTAECELRCLDTGHGPDKVWELDMVGRLGVFPHEASNSDVLAIGDLLIVATSNGQNEGHTRVPSPRAPSLIAVDKRTGDVVWRAVGPGPNVLHGQWSSPGVANVNGRVQVLFGGGDGWLRSYDASSGRELWRFDGNPPDAKFRPRPGVFSRGSIIATPVYGDGRVFIALGQDPTHGDGPSVIHAISPNGQGDVTSSRLLWSYRGVGRVVGTPVLKDGLLYVADLGGVVHCLDAATGAVVWSHQTEAPIWGCLLASRDRLYVGNTDGVMTVLATGRKNNALARIEMEAPLYSRPALAGDTLYVATARRLYAIRTQAPNAIATATSAPPAASISSPTSQGLPFVKRDQ